MLVRGLRGGECLCTYSAITQFSSSHPLLRLVLKYNIFKENNSGQNQVIDDNNWLASYIPEKKQLTLQNSWQYRAEDWMVDSVLCLSATSSLFSRSLSSRSASPIPSSGLGCNSASPSAIFTPWFSSYHKPHVDDDVTSSSPFKWLTCNFVTHYCHLLSRKDITSTKLYE